MTALWESIQHSFLSFCDFPSLACIMEIAPIEGRLPFPPSAEHCAFTQCTSQSLWNYLDLRETSSSSQHSQGCRKVLSMVLTWLWSSDSHTALEASVRSIWDPSGNSSGIWNFGVKAAKKHKIQKNLRRDLHYWSWDFRSILEKTKLSMNFMAV